MAAIAGLIIGTASTFSSATTPVNENGVIEKDKSVSFALTGHTDNFTLTIKFHPRFSEADYGNATPLFKILAGTDTMTLSPGIESYGSFEPSTFIKVTLNRSNQVKFTEKDDMINEGKEVTVCVTGNIATGTRLFVNGHRADFPSIQLNDSTTAITVIACRDFRYNAIEFDSKGSNADLPVLTIQEIIDRLPDTAKTPAGLYTWLDRENDPQRAQPGGFYKLAVIPDDNGGYDIVYLEGATVNRDSWKTGMLKGKLKKTLFLDHYDLIWYDSNHEPLTLETFCTFTDGTIMQLDFPLYSTRMRFSRLNGSAATLIPNR